MLIEQDVAMKQRVCAEDLEKAEPALVAAQAALDTLNKVISLVFTGAALNVIVLFVMNSNCNVYTCLK